MTTRAIGDLGQILGVDPGAVHVGVSEWDNQRCLVSYELTPEEFAYRIHKGGWLDRFDLVCAEAYVPQGGFGDAGTGVDTIKLLGYLEWTMLLQFDNPVKLTTRLDRAAALTRLKAVGYPFHDVVGRSGHARDAEAVVVAAMRWSARDVARAETLG